MSETKVTLDNLSSWDEAFAEAKGEKPDGAEEEEQEQAEEVSQEEGQEDKEKEEAEEKKEGAEETDAAESKEEAKEKKKAPRDYAQFEEQDRPFLEQMSRASFEHVGRRLLTLTQERNAAVEQVKEFNSGKTLPDQWYNDPAAAEASPDFKAVKTEFEKAQAETHRLSDLLSQYEAGQIKYNAATNTFAENDDESEPDPRIIRQLSDGRQQMYEKQKDLAQKGNAVLENFGRFYKDAEQQVSGSAEKLFPWLKDEKHENQQYWKQINGQWPRYFQTHPVAKLASALAVEHIKLKHAYAELQKQTKAKEKVKATARAAGPNGSRSGRVPNTDLDKKLTLDDFDGGKW